MAAKQVGQQLENRDGSSKVNQTSFLTKLNRFYKKVIKNIFFMIRLAGAI
jgi:hypothetical protein